MTLTLFGPPALAVGVERVEFTSERPFQLLAYLACCRRWVRRDEVAEILYPGREGAHARSNLRKVLLLAGRVPGVVVERRGDLLRWTPESDLGAFEAAIADRRLGDAIALGRSALLEGFDAAFVGDGKVWLIGERQRLAAAWQSACMRRLAELADRPADTAELAGLMLERDPLDEAALRALALACIACGEVEAARAAIAGYTELLRTELDLEPTGAVRALADAAGEACAKPGARAVAPPMALSADAFIGRRAELRFIVDLLKQPTCRILTLTGPGGVGKTALARQLAAWLVPTVVERVDVVPLADLTAVDQVPARIADHIGATLSGSNSAWSQIGNVIADRSLALILDNAEHLDIGGSLELLLPVAPRLKIVVTSRARLGIAAETTSGIEGLPLPDQDETDVDVLRCCDAVTLFEARALAATRSFDLALHAGDTVRLVHAVEGMPLAIELAATWVHLLPVAEIADEIVRSIDLLERGRGADGGLRASFAQSWRLLSNSERACLPRLAMLPGDIDRAMALQVAAAPLPLLAALVDKSLLRANGSGRFSMHPLLRSCAAELAVDGDEVVARHAGFVARWMGETDGSAAALQLLIDRIKAELAHVRAAWSWAIGCGDATVIERMARPLSNFYEQQGLWLEGMSALVGASQALSPDVAGDERARVAVLRGLATIQYRSGAFDEAQATSQALIGVARKLGDGMGVRHAFNISGICLRQRGRFAEALRFFQQGLVHAEKEGAIAHIALFNANIASAETCLGQYDRALVGQERALAPYREQNNAWSVAIALANLGEVHRALGQPARAIERLDEALAACKKHGFRSIQCTVSLNLGLSFEEVGRPEPGRSWLTMALRDARQYGEPLIEILALLASSRLDCEAGDTASAREKAWEALGKAEQRRTDALQVACVSAFAEILMHEGRPDDGLALLRWTIAQPPIDRLTRGQLERQLARLLARQEGVALTSRELSAETPLAAVLAIAAGPASAA